MEMDAKKIGLIVLVVVALGAVAWGFRGAFGGGGGRKTEADAAEWRTKMQKQLQTGTGGAKAPTQNVPPWQRGPGGPGGAPGMPGGPGAPGGGR